MRRGWTETVGAMACEWGQRVVEGGLLINCFFEGRVVWLTMS